MQIEMILLFSFPAKPIPLNVLPSDVAQEMKELAIAAAKQAVNEHYKEKFEAHADFETCAEEYEAKAKSFQEKAQGKLSIETCTEIKLMFKYIAGDAVKRSIVVGYIDTSQRAECNRHHAKILESGEVTPCLAENIKEMGTHASWFAVKEKAIWAKAGDFLSKLPPFLRTTLPIFDVGPEHEEERINHYFNMIVGNTTE